MSGTRAISTTKFFLFLFILQGKAPKEIHAILTETLTCFLPSWAQDLSAPLQSPLHQIFFHWGQPVAGLPMRLSSSVLWNVSFLAPAFYTDVPTASTFLVRPPSLFLNHYTVYKFRIKPCSPYTIIIFCPKVLLSILVSKVRNYFCVRVQHSIPKMSTELTTWTADSVCVPREKKKSDLPTPPPHQHGCTGWNVYTESEKLILSYGVTWAWSERVNL